MPPLVELARGVSVVLVNNHLTASYAQPRNPNIVPVASIHLQPSRPLPQNIQQFLDEASDGAILFSLGTLVPEHISSKELFDMFIAVFSKLNQRVLWKTKQTIKGLPKNVLTAPWLPQADILAHNNTVLFITHGGINSQIEAIHFGVPVITIPHFADQPRNAIFCVAKGVGLMIAPSALSKNTVSSAVQSVLTDKRYTQRMRALSAVFRDRPLSPEQTAVYWTEYVLRHGGAPHLRPTTQPLYQRALLDVLAAIVAAILITITLIHLICLNVYRSIKVSK